MSSLVKLNKISSHLSEVVINRPEKLNAMTKPMWIELGKIFKKISKTKLSLALISLVITFFVWQQGLRDSLNRPSVAFDIGQKEQEIVALAYQSIPTNLKSFFITNDPVNEINNALSQVLFNDLSDRNKIIKIISSESNEYVLEKNISNDFENKKFYIEYLNCH